MSVEGCQMDNYITLFYKGFKFSLDQRKNHPEKEFG